MLLPQCSIEDAQRKAEQFRLDLEALRPGGLPITASIGVAGLEADMDFKALFKRADEALYADKDRLMQVMSNLMSNAAKFSPEGSIVEISAARRSNGRIRISVTDFGSGVPVEFQDKLFDRFTQSDSSDARAKGGTGLGMAITKAVVEQHGGLINFITQKGIGSTFYIELSEVKVDLEQGDSPLLLDGDNDVAQVLIVEDDLDIAA